jgi:hypothetical protein
MGNTPSLKSSLNGIDSLKTTDISFDGIGCDDPEVGYAANDCDKLIEELFKDSKTVDPSSLSFDIFEILLKNEFVNDGEISTLKLKMCLVLCSDGNSDEKLKLIFDIFDFEGVGQLQGYVMEILLGTFFETVASISKEGDDIREPSTDAIKAKLESFNIFEKSSVDFDLFQTVFGEPQMLESAPIKNIFRMFGSTSTI